MRGHETNMSNTGKLLELNCNNKSKKRGKGNGKIM